MRPADAGRLVLLAALWGGSFIFMRILAPVLGPVVTADSRVLIAGVFLLLFFRLIKFDPEWRLYWKQYAVIGIVNSAFPFLLLSFAAQHIPAGYSATINASSPMFGAIYSAFWLGERLGAKKLLGLVVGALGVALVAGLGSMNGGLYFALGVTACIVASSCYGLAGVYIKLKARETKPMALAGASQFSAGLVLLPIAIAFPPTHAVTPQIVWIAIAFAILCSAFAYLLYFRLMQDIGPTKALTVTFLVPVFAVVWGFFLLREPVTPAVISGSVLILSGTGLVLFAGKDSAG